jgi:hypothetical protein
VLDRVDWVNRRIRRFADEHDDVRVVELGELLCPSGSPRVGPGGESYRLADGVGLSPAGAAATWSRLAREAAGDPR